MKLINSTLLVIIIFVVFGSLAFVFRADYPEISAILTIGILLSIIAFFYNLDDR